MRFAILLATTIGLQASLSAGSTYQYRISIESIGFYEAPGSKQALAQIPAGVALQETGLEGRPWIVSQNGEDWIHVAYWGEVGWVPLKGVAKVASIKQPANVDFTGLWVGPAYCSRPGVLFIQANGNFQGMRCISCSVEGCPEAISGTWSVSNGMLCIKESRGQSGCFFLWNQMLISDPETGFIWEYHGSAPLSGLKR